MSISFLLILAVYAIGGTLVLGVLVRLWNYLGRKNSQSDETALREFYARLEATESEQDAIKRRVENLEAIATTNSRSIGPRRESEESVGSLSVRSS
ncbi:MAG: hypothetical protein F4183_06670 [Rhodothermaceae bacterium]|nr:hypothetical protein [Rhodothermaceae bacterium]